MFTPSFDQTLIARAATGLYNLQVGNATMGWALDWVNGGNGTVADLVNQLYVRDFAAMSDAAVAAMVVSNVGITQPPGVVADAVAYVTGQLGSVATAQKGATIMAILQEFSTLASDPTYGSYATAFNVQINAAVQYAQNPGSIDTSLIPTVNMAGKVFMLTPLEAAGADVMRLTGDQDVRINFSNPANQITGLDLNGNGVIEADGVENAITGLAAGFEIVDAYSRNPLNHKDTANNFLGDIAFDGTGFQGDGVNTNGNIFLGGLGTDTAFGGIGNDFMTGGGIAQGRGGMDRLYGGRNADFFFAEFAAIDPTDGSSLFIDGGNTADDISAGNTQSAQDSDWLLIEASDDDEPVRIYLRDENLGQGWGWVESRAGKYMDIRDIENVDASGNLYGFLDDMDVRIGSRAVDDRGSAQGYNYAYGATAQLWISGSSAANIIIGGYDNDYIHGGDGNDLLMGGNLNFLNHPNLTQIWNNGRDELIGGAGDDHIVFETDGGIYEGGSEYNVDDSGIDTLWLTREAFGTRTAAQVTTDGTLRIDLGVGKVGGLNNYAGYGGADKAAATGRYTSDQTNYQSGYARAQVQDFENVIATGLGAVDYLAAGTNNPELLFANQQNHFGFVGNLDLRGTTGSNTLYAANGNDVLEGREGNDLLSGGPGNDDFLFYLGGSGDGVDVIHRQTDANGDNLWDGTFSQDFGLDSTTGIAESRLTVDFQSTDLALAQVAVTTFDVELDGVVYVGGTAAQLAAANSTAELAAILNASLSAQNADLSVVAQGNTVVVKSATGGTFATGLPGTIIAGTATNGTLQTLISAENDMPPVSQDRIIYVSYEDRADNERVDDDSFNGSTISLGSNHYAQDLVYHFGADGTRLAEAQAYAVTFTNLTTQDKVTVKVNSVEYTLQVGIDLDGNAIGNEDSIGNSQTGIQANFLARLRDFINSFNDKHTAAGQVSATLSGSTLTLTQAAYNGEETVFMTKPVVELQNLSLGEPPSASVTNVSSHEVHLLGFDGRDNKLNATNVLFWGDQEINRSVFETAKSSGGLLQGSEAVLIDGGANDLVDAPVGTSVVAINNRATNANLATNFSVHGDDLLIGGDGNDVILGGTGDDRIMGSRGNDTVDGGKNYVRVQVLGESQARVYVLNAWEAASVANLKSVLPELAGLTISSISVIPQSQSGLGTQSGVFSDTLQFQQADFAAGTRFEIELNDFTVTSAGVVQLRNDGAGVVRVDEGGNGVVDHTTKFTNFENIRTVSGTGKAVAGDGQGNDTLNVALMSAAAGGISYNLTNDGGGGEVRYSVDAIVNLVANPNDRPVPADYESLVLRVDGVENVIGGTGHDLLIIDETEAAKNNTFSAGLGVDRVIYRNAYTGNDAVAQPTVTIAVASAGNSTVTMTGGRNGTTVAVDTLSSVENITLENGTAEGSRENDVLDVTAYTNGVVVDYTNGQVRTSILPNTGVQLTIEGIARIENVRADGNDTVVVANSSAMSGLNARSDATGDQKDVTFATFLNYDVLDADGARLPFAEQSPAQIINVINEGQYTFDLSYTGGGNDIDTVDYSNATDAIAVVVEQDAGAPIQRVMVDSSGGTFDAVVGLNDRIDVLIDVEQVVASRGESVLDFTGSSNVEVKFSAPDPALRVAALDRDVSTVRIADLTTAVPLNRGFLEYRDAGLLAAVTQPKATWNRIEGGDGGERIILSSVQSFDNVAMNLRGGDNEAKYNELTLGINALIDLVEFDPAAPLTSGLIQAQVSFKNELGGALPGGGSHTVTSYTAGNGIAEGSLRIAASQGQFDSVSFANGGSDKLFILGVVTGTDKQIEVQLGVEDKNSMILTGFETLRDADSNDVYDFANLANVFATFTLQDNYLTVDDHDAVKVGNDAIGWAGSGANTISLDVINSQFNFDFDVLDITKVGGTAANLILNGSTNLLTLDADATNEVVLGALSRVSTINNFASMVLTDASVAAGSSFVFNPAAGTLTQGSTIVTTSAGELSFGGLVLEQGGRFGNSYVADVSTGVNVTVAGAAGAIVHGGAAGDTISGGAAADVIRGGGGNDVLSGGLGTETREIQILGFLDDDASGSTVDIVFNGAVLLSVTEGVEIPEGAGSVAIGDALAALVNANLAGINAGAGWTNGALTGATFNAATGILQFRFTAGEDVLDGETIVVSTTDALTGGIPFTASAENIVEQGGDGGNDTFLFEATGAANGSDTINAFTSGDVLDFSAYFDGSFLGAFGGYDFGVDVPEFGGDGWFGSYVIIGYNKATLAASDFAGATASNNNMNSVYITTADANNVADTTADPWKVYYVYDNDPTAGVNIVVELVATVNQPEEFILVPGNVAG